MKLFRKYFTFPTDTSAENLGINVLNLGHNIHPSNKPYPDGQHPDDYYFEWEKGRSLKEYQIIYIPKGEGYFESSGLPPQKIDAGTIILLYPDVWHRFRPEENTGWEEYWVGFSGAYAKYLLEQECFNAQKPIIKVGFNTEFLETFSRFIKIVEVREESYLKLSSFLLIQLLGIVYTSVLLSNQKKSRKEDIIDQIRNEIHQKWNSNIDFEQLAQSNNLGYVWFRKTFKEVLGTSPNQYHLLLKLRKAELLIQDSHLTLAEVAYQCGFESEFYFSRIFKKKMNYNPSDIRKRNSKTE